MLAVILALTVGLASLVFFFSAFFAPKLHRKDDFLWSGVGFFYALVLWLCAQRLTGGVLLGQGAATVLILSFAWQTLKLRATVANAENLPALNSFSLLDWLSGGLRKPKTVKPQPPQAPMEPESAPEPASTVEPEVNVEMTELTEVTAETVEEILEVVEDIVETASPETPTIINAPPQLPSDAGETVEQASVSDVNLPPIEPETPEPEAGPSPVTERPSAPAKAPSTKPSKPGFFSHLFGRRSTPPPTIREALDNVAQEDIEDELGELDDLELVDEAPQETQENEPRTLVIPEVETVAKVETIDEDFTVPVETEESVPAEMTEAIENTEMSESLQSLTPVVALEDEGSPALGVEDTSGDNNDNTAVREEIEAETLDEAGLLEDLDDLLEDEPAGSELETVLESPVDLSGPEISDAATSADTWTSSDSSSADTSDSSSSASDL
jgi:hypothetical protein